MYQLASWQLLCKGDPSVAVEVTSSVASSLSALDRLFAHNKGKMVKDKDIDLNCCFHYDHPAWAMPSSRSKAINQPTSDKRVQKRQQHRRRKCKRCPYSLEYGHRWWKRGRSREVKETEKWVRARKRTKGEAEWWQDKHKDKPGLLTYLFHYFLILAAEVDIIFKYRLPCLPSAWDWHQGLLGCSLAPPVVKTDQFSVYSIYII